MFRPRRLFGLLIGPLLIGSIGYFGYMGWEGSAQLVHPPNPNRDCRTPTLLGWEYEAINYDRASDADLLAREADPSDCSAPGAEPGEEVVSDDGVRIAGWWIPAAAPLPADGPTVVVVHGYGDNKSGMFQTAMIIHGGDDRDAPTEGAERLSDVARDAGVPVELHLCPGADHGKSDEVCADDYGRWLNDFLLVAIGG